MKSAEIRSEFLKFFEQHGHRVVASSPLVPGNDPTLLFTNAGMVQFKDVFLGAEKRAYVRAASSQRCVRAGGKHNDLDQVGYTARHHTFFEMLGNFSFGDYFKHDAIVLAWEFLTEICGLPKEKLWITVYKTDEEAYDIWLKVVGIPADRVIRIGDKPDGKTFESDNFWAMGDTGPCGPCTEIFYDHGEAVAGGPPGSAQQDGDRYIEVWNLVFMQFDRDSKGDMRPLPKPCVDTGMGLERLAAILQGVHSNYEIDLFQRLIGAASQLTGCQDSSDNSLKVIADHIRACAFLIVDGVLPHKEGRGYVLRRIVRRAIRHGYKLGQKDLFFHAMVPPLVDEMGAAYPELRDKAEFVASVLKAEEEHFAITLEQGMGLLEATIADLGERLIPGEAAFRLYDTYGFPLDLTADIARERGLTVDTSGFHAAMAEQKARARAASGFSAADHVDTHLLHAIPATEFLGYRQELDASAEVLAILVDGQSVAELASGKTGTVLLNQTPFYAESGGQIGDQGTLAGPNGQFKVQDTKKIAGTYHGHFGQMTDGALSKGDIVTARVDWERRQAIVLNHSATHLLHAALRYELGEHVEQKGSLVAAERLRFDFSHFQPVDPDTLIRIEMLVNEQIRANAPANAKIMTYDEAVASGAMALFGEKYGDEVRVMRFGEFSVELCGGTHVQRLGDIGLFKIIAESGIAAGVRRIEAMTGAQAIAWTLKNQQELEHVGHLLKAHLGNVTVKVRQLVDRERALEKELMTLKARLHRAAGDELIDQAEEINGVKVVAATLREVSPKELRDAVDRLKNKLGSAAVVLATVNDGKVQLVAGVSQDQIKRIKAGALVNRVATQVGGRGGGRADMAQAGGNEPHKLSEALASVSEWVRQQLADS